MTREIEHSYERCIVSCDMLWLTFCGKKVKEVNTFENISDWLLIADSDVYSACDECVNCAIATIASKLVSNCWWYEGELDLRKAACASNSYTEDCEAEEVK